MKLRVSVVMALLLGPFVLCSGLTYADELKGSVVGSLDALNSGYAITRWPWDGGVIYIGDDATVRACTTKPPYPEATQVAFRWIRPDNTSWVVGPKNLTISSDTWGGLPIHEANDTQPLKMLGDWGVQALFCGADGKELPISPCPTVKIKAISWHVIPEVPLGTIATILCMLGALSVFFIKKKALMPKR